MLLQELFSRLRGIEHIFPGQRDSMKKTEREPRGIVENL